MNGAIGRGRVLLVLVCLSLLAVGVGAASRDRVLLVRIAATPTEASRLERMGIDLVETRDGPDVLALVDDIVLRRLQQGGWDVHEEQALISPGMRPETFREGYRTVEEVEQLIKGWDASYPNLVQLEDYGDSWERVQAPNDPTVGHDLWALRLTDEQVAGIKPRFFLMAAIHAREIVTTEIALRWAAELLGGYGVDPNTTDLFRTREIWIVPIANPDGYARAETEILWRKNTNAVDAPCDEQTGGRHPGVDLNRNSSWRWGTIDQPSLPPCWPTFPGNAVASEPEVVSLEALLSRLFPPREGDTDSAGCDRRRTDTPGIMITLHSFGDLVLYPWGDISEPACLDAQLAALGQQFGAYNGYTVMQSSKLYPTSGATDDWSYGALGIASYTFEIGPSESSNVCSGFFAPFTCVDEFYARNRGALLLAARFAYAPYQLDMPELKHVYVPVVQR